MLAHFRGAVIVEEKNLHSLYDKPGVLAGSPYLDPHTTSPTAAVTWPCHVSLLHILPVRGGRDAVGIFSPQ